MSPISRRQFIKEAAAGSAWLALGGLKSLTGIEHGVPGHPNLVIVFPDQMRGQAMGFLNEESVLTPHLDRFAKESIVFTHAVSNYPLCSPYRAMLWTGKYPQANKVMENCTSESAKYQCELRASERCLSDILKDKGYSLGYIGKWHLDSPHKPYVKSYNNTETFAWNEWCPPDRRHGFEFWYAYGTYDQHLAPMYWASDTPRDKAFIVHEWGPIHEASLAVEYIRNENGKFRAAGRPFALVVSMNPPHMPYEQVPQTYVDMYQDASLEKLCGRPNIPPAGTKWGDYYRKNIRNYFAMITGVDSQFGRIIQSLKEAGLAENTIVVFTSDHGNCLGIHDEISKNNHYEESMRIPLLVRWPKKIKPRREDLLISVPDMVPTVLDLMGFGRDIPVGVEGTNHASLILTGKGERPTSQLYLGIPAGRPAWGKRGVRTHTHTLMIRKTEGKPAEHVLYDREKDPFQLKNIADESPRLVSRLLEEELNPWLRKTGDSWLNS